jgi:hypothetical protein
MMARKTFASGSRLNHRHGPPLVRLAALIDWSFWMTALVGRVLHEGLIERFEIECPGMNQLNERQEHFQSEISNSSWLSSMH